MINLRTYEEFLNESEVFDSMYHGGDVDFNNVAPKCSYISPVPGGVGMMTIAALLMNTYTAAKTKSEK